MNPPSASDLADQELRALREKMLKQVLRQSMADHGVPGDWLECRVLPASRSSGLRGVHVQLVANGGGQALLQYVQPFQASFLRAMARHDPQSREWIFGVAWVFNDPEPSPGGVWQLPLAPASAAAARR